MNRINLWVSLILLLAGFNLRAQTLTVTGTAPQAGSNGHHPDTSLKFTFNNPVTNGVDTTGFFIHGSQNGRLKGQFSGQSSSTIVFNPDSSIPAGTKLNITLTRKIKSSPADSLAPYVYQAQVKQALAMEPFSTSIERKASGATQLFSSQSAFNVAGDLDNDGHIDVLMFDVTNAQVRIFKNNGNATFANTVSYAYTGQGIAPELLDVDKDGDLDAVMVNQAGNLVTFVNNGNATFSAVTGASFSVSAYDIEAADMDGDGDLDLVGTFNATLVRVFLNNNGVFTGTNYSSTNTSTLVTLADIDNDRDIDVVTSHSTGFTVLTNNGSGALSLSASIAIPGISAVSYINAADIDNDGDMDVITSNYASSTSQAIRIYSNTNGTISSSGILVESSVSYANFRGFYLHDLNGDGQLDFFVPGNTYNGILMKNGSGTYSDSYQLQKFAYNYTNPATLAVADFDHDNDLDLFGITDNQLLLFRNAYRVNVALLFADRNIYTGNSQNNILSRFYANNSSAGIPYSELHYQSMTVKLDGNYTGLKNLKLWENSNSLNTNMDVARLIGTIPVLPAAGGTVTFSLNDTVKSNSYFVITVDTDSLPSGSILCRLVNDSNVKLSSTNVNVTVPDSIQAYATYFKNLRLIDSYPKAYRIMQPSDSLVLRFSKNINTATAADYIIIKNNNELVSGVISAANNEITFKPSSPLKAGTVSVFIGNSLRAQAGDSMTMNFTYTAKVNALKTSYARFTRTSNALASFTNFRMQSNNTFTGRLSNSNLNLYTVSPTGSVSSTLLGSSIAAIYDCADLNNDGLLDYVQYNGSQISIGITNGSYQNISVGTTSAVRIEDMDGDGYNDIFFTSGSSTYVYYNTANGTGIFITPYVTFSNVAINNPSFADLNNDGIMDVYNNKVVYYGNSLRVSPLNNTIPGLGTLASLPAIVCDLNKDGATDLILTGSGATSYYCTNNGYGYFRVDTINQSVRAYENLNGDEWEDALVFGNSTTLVYPNNGTNQLATAVSSAGLPGSTLAFRDLNNDGDLDIVSFNGSQLIVMLNQANVRVASANSLEAFFNPAVPQTLPATDYPVGRIKVYAPDTGVNLTRITALAAGARTGLGNFKLWKSTDSLFVNKTQVGPVVATDPGNNGTLAFTGINALLDTGNTWLFITADVGTTASGSIKLTTGTLRGTGMDTAVDNFVFANQPANLFDFYETDPAHNSTSTEFGDSTIVLKFNHPLLPSSIDSSTLTIEGSLSGRVFPNNIAFSNNNQTLTLTHQADFKTGEKVTFVTTNKIKNANNDTLSQKRTSEFSIGAAPSLSNYAFADSVTLSTTSSGSITAARILPMDIDKDNDLDVLCVLSNGRMGIVLNDGTGVFTIDTIFAFSNGLPVVSDLNNDGYPDLLLMIGGSSIRPYMNNKSRRFIGGTSLSVANLTGMHLNDLDGDGDNDLVFRTTTGFGIRFNNGSGTFTGTGSFSASTDFSAMADLNGDGLTDLVTVSASGMNWYEHQGNGVFTGRSLKPHTDFMSLMVADFDNDNDIDIMARRSPAMTNPPYHIYLNDGNGNFNDSFTYTANASTNVIGTLDFNGDGQLDLATMTTSGTNPARALYLIENKGRSFATARTITLTGDNSAYLLATADVDNDNIADLLTINVLTNQLHFHCYGSRKIIQFTDGRNFKTAIPAVSTTNFVLGKFFLQDQSDYPLLTSAFITGNGNRTGLSNFKLWASADSTFGTATATQIGATVATDPGNGFFIPFSGLSDSISINKRWYFLTANIGSNASGTFQAMIANNASLQFSGGSLTTTISDALLSSNIVNLFYVTGTNPANLHESVHADTSIVINFNQTINQTSVDPNSVIVHSNMTGRVSATYQNTGTSTLVNPARSLFPNEKLTITSNFGLLNAQSDGLGFGQQTTHTGAAANAAGIFANRPPISTVFTSPVQLLAGDFNNDGRMDLAVFGTQTTVRLTIILNDSVLGFSSKTNYNLGALSRGTTLDLDNDGDLDIVAIQTANGTMIKLTNNGSGVFAMSAPIATYTEQLDVVSGDFNQDGYMDLVLPCSNFTGKLLQNDGTGNFGTPVSFPLSSTPKSATVADMNNDFMPDMVTLSGRYIIVTINKGNTVFVNLAQVLGNTGSNDLSSLAARDFDGDGDIDIAVSNPNNQAVSIFKNNGEGVLSLSAIYPAGSFMQNLGAGDFDGDGDIDLVSAQSSPNISVAFNDGSGGFAKNHSYNLTTTSLSPVVADFDGDRQLDFAVLNQVNNVTIMLNQNGVLFENGETDQPFAGGHLIPGTSFNPIGRFTLKKGNYSDTSLLTTVAIKLNDARTGASNFTLWKSTDQTFGPATDIQLGATIAGDPGAGNTITFSGFSDTLTTTTYWYFLTADVALNATGSIMPVLVNNTSLTISNGIIADSLFNEKLAVISTTLPVKFLGVDVKRNNDLAIITWSTSTEINCAQYQVMKSYNNEQWTAIGSIPCSNSMAVNQYLLTDQLTDADCGRTIYYRIRQVDLNQREYVTPVKSVTYTCQQLSASASLVVMPNPNKGTFAVKGTYTRIRLLDQLGREVAHHATVKNNTTTIGVDQPETGILYLITESDNGPGTFTKVLIGQ